MIQIDKTLIVQLIVFVAFALLMNQFAFKPFLRLLEERHRRIFGTKEEAERLREEAEGLRERYEGEIRKRREEALRESLSLREESRRAQEELIERTREEVSQALKEAKERIAQESTLALRELEEYSRELALKVAGRLLGRPLE